MEGGSEGREGEMEGGRGEERGREGEGEERDKGQNSKKNGLRESAGGEEERRERVNERGRERDCERREGVHLVESSLDISLGVFFLMLKTVSIETFRLEILWFWSTDCSFLLQLRLEDTT